MLQHVRLPLMSPKFLVGTVGADLLVKSDDSCRDLVDEAKNYLLLPQERPLMQGPRTRPRKPIRCGEVLFAGMLWSAANTSLRRSGCIPVNCIAILHPCQEYALVRCREGLMYKPYYYIPPPPRTTSTTAATLLSVP